MQTQIQEKLINHEPLTVKEINLIGKEGLDGKPIAVFNNALYYLLEQDDYDAFDCLLDEFYSVARKKDLIMAINALISLKIKPRALA